MSSLCVSHIPPLSLWFSAPLRLLFVFHSPLFFFLLFWKAVSLNPIQFLSAWGSFKALAPWSGPSILSPTSRLFKRAKAQRCSFLNTQIHPSTNRGTAVWQRSLSLRLSLALLHYLSSPWTLTPPHHPAGLLSTAHACSGWSTIFDNDLPKISVSALRMTLQT